MSTAERAGWLVNSVILNHSALVEWYDGLVQAVELAMDAAVDAERDRCIEICKKYTSGPGDEGPGTAWGIIGEIKEGE